MCDGMFVELSIALGARVRIGSNCKLFSAGGLPVAIMRSG